jgi:hypothetical protein
VRIIRSAADSSFSTSLLSLGVSEKKAVSEAEIMAERHKRMTINTNAIIEFIEIGEISIPENKEDNVSESKIKKIKFNLKPRKKNGLV